MSDRFEVEATPFDGLVVLNRKILKDDRGFLTRLFCPDDLEGFGWSGRIAQVNETGTVHRGTVRGMHFQNPPFAEIKLISCTRGRVLDVVVDVRRGSPTFLKHYAVELSEDNGRSLLVPKGFAHGFQTLVDGAHMLYMHSESYIAASEGGLHSQDPRLAIEWPLPVTNLSARDAGHPLLSAEYAGVSP